MAGWASPRGCGRRGRRPRELRRCDTADPEASDMVSRSLADLARDTFDSLLETGSNP
jgi:hypothetical protein